MITRREFMQDVALVSAASTMGYARELLAAEPPPETTRIRIVRSPAICFAPLYVAEDLLRAEGFTDVQYVKGDGGLNDDKMIAKGDADLMAGFAGRHILALDAGDPIVVLAGMHPGCYELFATKDIRSIRDLKGKQVAVTQLTSGRHILLAVMAVNVGLDPRKDIRWVTDPPQKSIQLFAEGKIDGFMSFPPENLELRAKKVGHVLVNTTLERPWSQYFCCMIASNREFVRKHPVAAKRALRALLKANAICTSEPQRAGKLLVDKGYTKNVEHAVQTIKELPYDKWHDYDPADTLRFYALRMHEAGMIKSSPQKLLAQGADWRFVNQLKKELKA
jgi:NitT/TauT family transport system substrate-binding protein